MVHVSKHYFIPNVSAVLIYRIRAQNICIWILFRNPSLGGVFRVKSTLDLEDSKVLWPATGNRPLLAHSTSFYLDSYNNNPLLCFITNCASAIQASWMLYSDNSPTVSPLDRSLFEDR